MRFCMCQLDFVSSFHSIVWRIWEENDYANIFEATCRADNIKLMARKQRVEDQIDT